MVEEKIGEWLRCPKCKLSLWQIVGSSETQIALECPCGFRVVVRYWHRAKGLRIEVKCPQCGNAPPIGKYWACGDPIMKEGCRTRFDTFETNAECPSCKRKFQLTNCPICGKTSPFTEWFKKEKKEKSHWDGQNWICPRCRSIAKVQDSWTDCYDNEYSTIKCTNLDCGFEENGVCVFESEN
jgi:hypothetical protein